jgi:hypothetical protein
MSNLDTFRQETKGMVRRELSSRDEKAHDS